MALSLESIYQPISEFFLKKFETELDSPVFFRFDKFGEVISCADFHDPDNPRKGIYNFSDLVNQVLIEDADGLNVIQSVDYIDDVYQTILNASIPWVSDDDPFKEEIINNFARTKAEAIKELELRSLPYPGPVPVVFNPSYAVPENWYDQANNEIWTKHTFEVKESTSVGSSSANQPMLQLWRLKVDDRQLQHALPKEPISKINPEVYNHIRLLYTNPALPNTTTVKPLRSTSSIPYLQAIKTKVAASKSPTPAKIVASAAAPTVKLKVMTTQTQVPKNTTFTPILNSYVLNESIGKYISELNVKEKRAVKQQIKKVAPTTSVTTHSISINFEYCKVNIHQPWLHKPFVNNSTWFVPGLQKGQSTSASTNANMGVLPIAFIAIKNLSIEANWSDSDIANAKIATDFGPFEVNSAIVNNKLSMDGIQVIGWLLQRMPALPPNDPPQQPLI